MHSAAIHNNCQIIKEVCQHVEESLADISDIKKMQRKIGWLALGQNEWR